MENIWFYCQNSTSEVNYYFPLYQKDNVQGSENKTKQNYLDAFQY